MLKIILLTILLAQIITPQAFAVEPPSPAQEKNIAQINDRIDQLKNKVASKVAELKLVEKRGMVGKVDSISSTQITIVDINNQSRIIDVDEITKFESKEGISSITKGDTIGALGLYNKESERLLARFITEYKLPLFIRGVITSKDEENFTVSVTTVEGTTYIVDVERLTKTFSFDKELEDAGFSGIKLNQNTVVVGFKDPKEKNRVTASKIVTFVGIPRNPKIRIVEVSPTTIPSTGSGVKLTPIGQ